MQIYFYLKYVSEQSMMRESNFTANRFTDYDELLVFS